MKPEMYQSMYDVETYHWFFRAKYEIVLDVLESYGLVKHNQPKIVDFGCGCGVMLQKLSEYGDTTGIDFSNDALYFCRKSFYGDLIQANLENFDAHDSFDYGIALDVIEHIQDDRKAMKSIFHALRDDGICVFTVPAFQCLWSEHDENCMHLRRYTYRSLINLISEAGFRIEYCSYYNFHSFIPVYLIRHIERFLRIPNSGSKLEYGFSNGYFNSLLYKIFSSEKKRIRKKCSFPFGVSLICVARKQHDLE